MKNITEFSSDLNVAVQMSTLETYAPAVKLITEAYLKRDYAKYLLLYICKILYARPGKTVTDQF